MCMYAYVNGCVCVFVCLQVVMCFSSVPLCVASSRCHDCCRHTHQQNGTCPKEGLLCGRQTSCSSTLHLLEFQSEDRILLILPLLLLLPPSSSPSSFSSLSPLPTSSPGVRSNARAPMGHLHGELCQRRRLLPLLIRSGAGL